MIATNIFSVFGDFSIDSIKSAAWAEYQNFAIPLINNEAKKMRECASNVSNMSLADAKELFEGLIKLESTIHRLMSKMNPIEDVDFLEFKNTFIYYSNSIDNLIEELEDKAIGSNIDTKNYKPSKIKSIEDLKRYVA